jgi:hypothetical protein
MVDFDMSYSISKKLTLQTLYLLSLPLSFIQHLLKTTIGRHDDTCLIIPALGRLRQEAWEFWASLGNMVRPCLKQKQTTKYQHWHCHEAKIESGKLVLIVIILMHLSLVRKTDTNYMSNILQIVAALMEQKNGVCYSTGSWL